MTAPLYYPPADHTTQNFADTKWAGDTMPHTNVLLLHSTEGGTWPTYDYEGQGNGSSAPNATYHPGLRKFRQHFPANMSSRALVNLPGGDETNTLNVFQVEIIGTCDPTLHQHDPGLPYMPTLGATAIDDLAHLWLWLHQNYSVPLTAIPATRWLAYPASYGANGVRLTQTQWENFTGVCGHQHAVENVHGDPGKFPIAKLLSRVKALAGGAADRKFPVMNALDEDAQKLRSTAAAQAKKHPKWAASGLNPLVDGIDKLHALVQNLED